MTNSITAIGRSTKDAELKFTANGDPVLGFTVASDVGFGDKKHALFFNCSVWGKRAEALAPYITKGIPLTVIGELDQRAWESNGKSGTSLDVRVNEVALQGGKQDSKPEEKPQGFRKPAEPDNDFQDDDIPF